MNFTLAREIDPVLNERWEAFVLSQKTGSLYQLSLWKELYEPKTHRWLFFWGEDNRQIRFSALIRGRKIPGLGLDCSIARGPVCDEQPILNEGLKQMLPVLKKEKVIRLKVNPYWEFPAGEAVEAGLQGIGFQSFQLRGDSHFETLVIDLIRPPDEIYRKIRKVTRYGMNRAKKLGLSVSIATSEEDLKKFYELLEEMSQEKRIRIPSYFFFNRLWKSVLEKGSLGILLMSYLQDLPISGIIILKHGERAVYSWGASGKEPRFKIAKTHSAVWEGILWAQRAGCRLFDMGGYTPGEESTLETEKVDRFKSGFGGEACQLVRIHQYTFNKIKAGGLRIFWP
jgi:lipid II:glycine glycyltransferase (peptidoglycan interpeptide bridge formation enzyme)